MSHSRLFVQPTLSDNRPTIAVSALIITEVSKVLVLVLFVLFWALLVLAAGLFSCFVMFDV